MKDDLQRKQMTNKTNQESKCTYSCAGQKLTALFNIHFLIKLFILTFSLLYKTLSGYCTSIASQVRVTVFKSEMQRIYTWILLLYFFMGNFHQWSLSFMGIFHHPNMLQSWWVSHQLCLFFLGRFHQLLVKNSPNINAALFLGLFTDCDITNHMLRYTWLTLNACNVLMIYQGHTLYI